jgi:hypothetical protein
MPARDCESHFITTDGWHTEHLRSVFNCATKNAEVITIALDPLQGLIAMRAVSLYAIPATIRRMNDCISQGVDTAQDPLDSPLPRPQLPHHSWQTTRKLTCFRPVLPLLFTDGPALLLRFKLHESRTVVSSTAVATLHQLVMFIVDKVEQEDRRMLLVNVLESITLPDGATQVPVPERATRFLRYLQDVCLLGNGERFLSN